MRLRFRAGLLRLDRRGGLEALELLLLVSERMLNEGLFITCHDSDGSVVFNAPYGEWLRLFRENGLEVREEIAASTARLIANPVAHKLKAAAIDDVIARIRGTA